MSVSVRESSKQKPSYWHSVGTEPLSTLTLGQLVDMAAERWAHKEAVKSLYEGRSFTFRELRDKADRLAAGLLQLGLSPGDRLGIWGLNSSDWLISRIAAARAGLIAVLMDPAYQGPQLLHGFNKVDIKALICSEFYKTNSCYQIVRTVIPELDNCPESGVELKSSKAPALKALILMSEKKYRGAYRLSDIMASARLETMRIIQELQMKIQPDEGCAIQFSSGTTGSPKGALVSNHNIVNNSMALGRRIGLDAEGAKTMAGTPFYHTSGSMLNIFCTLSFGVTTVIAAPVLDARRIMEGIIQERCTHIFTTSSLYLDMISTSQDLGLKVMTLEVASYGAAPCSQELALQIKEVLNARALIPVFGMTEVAAMFCSRKGDTLQQTTATVGYLMDHCEAKVVDKEGRMVPMGTPGELWVRGYSVMLGYWNEEEKTRQFIGSDGWAKTGDQFVLQEDGYARIVGRLKDMIIRISDNIFPVEIEEFFTGHPDILEAQAFGVPDTRVGEEICVFLRLRNGATLTEQDVRNYCKDKVSEYKIPRYIRFVKEFERTVVGKVQKFRLLQQFQQELTQNTECDSEKLSYWHQCGSKPLSPLTLGRMIDIAVARWGHKEAFVSLYQGHRITFKEARNEADRLAAGLLQLGLSPGDRLAIWGPNSSEWYISRFASGRAGLIAVQIDPAYQGPQLLSSLNKVGVKALICSEFYKTNSCYQIVRTVIPELDNCPESGVELKSSKAPTLKALILMSDKQYRGAYRFSDVMASARQETMKIIQEIQTKIQPDDGCCIQFSSGTTGSPKAALLSHHNLINSSLQMGTRFELDIKETKMAVTAQFCHTSGSALGIILGLCYGIPCVIFAPVFDARKTLEGVIRERCTHIFAIPSVYLDMVSTAKDLGFKVTTLQVAVYGAAPCSQQLAWRIKETLNVRRLVPGYGLTEISIVFLSKPEDTLEQMTTTVGFAQDHIEAKVVDKEGRMVPMGTPGELWIRGYSVMLGYWDDEEETRQFIGPDGWVRTGDQFVLLEDGYGKIVGRMKDMIIRAGDKIFPKDIEDFLTEHPDVLEAQAFGVPDARFGEEICVFLKLRDGATLTEEDVRNYCKDKVAEYRIPRYIRFVKEFERTAGGKVQRVRLLQQFQQELTQNVS